MYRTSCKWASKSSEDLWSVLQFYNVHILNQLTHGLNNTIQNYHLPSKSTEIFLRLTPAIFFNFSNPLQEQSLKQKLMLWLSLIGSLSTIPRLPKNPYKKAIRLWKVLRYREEYEMTRTEPGSSKVSTDLYAERRILPSLINCPVPKCVSWPKLHWDEMPTREKLWKGPMNVEYPGSLGKVSVENFMNSETSWDSIVDFGVQFMYDMFCVPICASGPRSPCLRRIINASSLCDGKKWSVKYKEISSKIAKFPSLNPQNKRLC